jgi:hypothetical protein
MELCRCSCHSWKSISDSFHNHFHMINRVAATYSNRATELVRLFEDYRALQDRQDAPSPQPAAPALPQEPPKRAIHHPGRGARWYGATTGRTGSIAGSRTTEAPAPAFDPVGQGRNEAATPDARRAAHQRHTFLLSLQRIQPAAAAHFVRA